MALEAQVESLESVPEDLRGEYAEVDGKYQLKVLQGFVPKDKVEDVTGLKSALHKEREAAREYARKLRQVEDQYSGFDVEELQKLREEQAKAEEERAKRSGEWDSLKNQLLSKHGEEKESWTKERSELLTAFENQLAEAAAVQAIADNKGNGLLLKPHVRAAMKVFREDSGEFVTRIVDDAGNPRMNGDGKYLTVSEYVKELRDNETFAGAFLGAGSSGGGTPPGAGQGQGAGGKGGIPSDLKRGSMSTRQKVDFIKEFGHDEFMKLPA